MNVLPESKVTVPLAVNVAVGLILQLLQAYVHGFHAPPAATVAGIVTVVTFVAGWLAPHTSRSVDARLSELVRLAHEAGAEIVVDTHAVKAVQPAAPPAPSGYYGGYTGSKPASEMPPPPTDVPSVSKPPGGTAAGTTP